MREVYFDAEQVRDRLVAAIREHAEREGFTKVVLGISGGKDSTVTAALCARALGKENVYGVMLPDGVQKDLSDSRRVCEALGIRKRTVNIGAVHEALRDATDQREITAPEDEFVIPFSKQSETNVAPRLRMTALRPVTVRVRLDDRGGKEIAAFRAEKGSIEKTIPVRGAGIGKHAVYFIFEAEGDGPAAEMDMFTFD